MNSTRPLLRIAIWVLPVAILAVTFSVWQRGSSGQSLTGQAAQAGFCCLDNQNTCQPSTFDACAANARFEAFDTSEAICNAQCGGAVMYCQNRADVIAGRATAVCSPQLVQGEFAFVNQNSCESVCGANTCADCTTCNGAAKEGIACSQSFCEMNKSCLWNAGAASCGQKPAVCGGASSSAQSSTASSAASSLRASSSSAAASSAASVAVSSARSSSSGRSSSAASIAPVVCGNGLIQAVEQCDDGNVADGDGCSRLCVVEDGFLCNP